MFLLAEQHKFHWIFWADRWLKLIGLHCEDSKGSKHGKCEFLVLNEQDKFYLVNKQTLQLFILLSIFNQIFLQMIFFLHLSTITNSLDTFPILMQNSPTGYRYHEYCNLSVLCSFFQAACGPQARVNCSYFWHIWKYQVWGRGEEINMTCQRGFCSCCGPIFIVLTEQDQFYQKLRWAWTAEKTGNRGNTIFPPPPLGFDSWSEGNEIFGTCALE